MNVAGRPLPYRALAAFRELRDAPETEQSRRLAALRVEDPPLAQHVLSLLAADAATEGPLERARDHVEEAARRLLLEGEPEPPQSLGAWRLAERLGAGGMGEVWLAQRADGAFLQTAAIKLVHPGMASPDVMARFLAERQILAHLNHPAIAKVLDGGRAADGRPWFAMELVSGQPITSFADERRLGLVDRLRLFVRVCGAVDFAHRSLIVHRDLKPSNILVTDAGEPKLLDFGLAKLLDPGNDPSFTRTHVLALTPAYAAPEQILGGPVTTATDVYALGVVLFELLTGQRPYAREGTTPAALADAVRRESATRPSTAVRRWAADGRPDAARSARSLTGDLDSIALRALHPEPARRYPSAAALADDVCAFLERRPVAARPDSFTYRASRFVRRHRLGVAAAALVGMSVAGGTLVAVWQAQRARSAARKAAAVKDFLKSLFAAVDPAQALGRERTAKELLDDGAQRLEKDLAGQPEVQSEVSRLMADVYYELGEYDRARDLLTADLQRRRRLDGPGGVAVAEVLAQLAQLDYRQSRFDEAARGYEEVLAIQRHARGERSVEVATTLRGLADLKWNRGDFEGAERLQSLALEILVEATGTDTRGVSGVRQSLANAYAQNGRDIEAAALQELVVAWRGRHLGPDHPDTLAARHNYAYHLLRVGRTVDSMRTIEDVLAKRRRVLGARHSNVGQSLQVLARALDALGRSDEGLSLMGEAIAIHREAHGPDHLQVALDLSWQGVIEARTAGLAAAERSTRAALELFAARPDAAPPFMATAQANAGIVFADAGRLEEAERHLAEALGFFRKHRQQGVSLARVLDRLGDVARQRGQYSHAATLAREALIVQERGVQADDSATALVRARTGAALWAAGHADEGERLLRASITWLERTFAGGHPDLATSHFLLGEALARSGRREQALPHLENAFAWRSARLGATDPRTTATARALESAAP